jgi:hypothetical protein
MRAFAAFLPNHGSWPEARFWVVFRLSGPPSLTQPNHGHFGTDVGSSHIQWLKDRSKGRWFESRPVRRSKLGANEMVRYRTCRGVRHPPRPPRPARAWPPS